jgi:threonine dehydratase
MIALDAIRRAAEVIAAEAIRTPVVRSDELDALVGAAVFCKDESRQRAGSFKFRGAFTRLSAIPAADRRLGVVAVSSGNHGAAVACAAQILGIEATVHVPADVAPAKRALIEEFGARIVTFERSTPDREAGARRQAADTGATLVHPFEDPLVMCGQGTAALELHEQVGPLDVLVVPMSGGGLMAGCASAMRKLDPTCELVGVEPSTADDTRRSFVAGHPVRITQPDTIADGLAVTRPGDVTFSVNRELVSAVVTVTDDELVAAMRLGHTLLGQRYEPSGVAGLAAIVVHSDRFAGRRVGVVLTGGNIDAGRFAELTSIT